MVLSAVDDILDRLREIIADAAPDVRFVSKYGGEVLCPLPDDDKTFVGGIFGYSDHATMEFSKGAGFDDPDGHLIGRGKARRHLKFETLQDIDSDVIAGFLHQALNA